MENKKICKRCLLREMELAMPADVTSKSEHWVRRDAVPIINGIRALLIL